MHVSVRTAAFLSLIVLASGCATMSGSQEQYYVCSYDVVWDASVETMKGYSISSQDKEKGQIETGWLDVQPTSERTFGIFGREGFGNKERARLSVSVKHLNDVAAVSVLETRQRWHSRGGVTSQATKWWPVDPSESAMTEVTAKINSKLQEKGCAHR